MRSYLIDEIPRADIEKIRTYLREKKFKSPIEDIFWIQVPEELLTSEQKEHISSCGPYIFSLELGRDFIKLELLVRATNKIRCSCISFANLEQINYGINLIENIYLSAINGKKLN
ncbi:hypothetical protein JCM13304A_21090 [Desulfothermus okinawensis JCM 13304]